MATYTSNYAWTKPAGTDPVDISVLNDNLDSQDSVIHDAFLNMAAPFSESSTYAVGAIVLYGTKTYKCHTAVTTAGSWTGLTNWQEYKLAEGGDLDDAPTDGSNNPVKSDGIYDSEKDIYAVMGQMGAKNLIPYPYYKADDTEQPTTGTDKGITWTINDDKSVTITGEATADFRFDLAVRSRVTLIPLKAGSYKLTGCPSGGSEGTYSLFLNGYQAGTSTAITTMRDTGDGITRAYAFDVVAGVYIHIKSGTLIQDPLVFKPMLRIASDTDPTYQPYAKTNKQLTDEISTKVDKVTGKGLSTNDYDNTAKGIVDGVTANLALKADKTATASGETLTLVPTSEGRALLHTAYGMSTQDGTPTPSSPVDIVSAKADFRSVGKNLVTFPYDHTSKALNGVTFTINNDNTVSVQTVSGGATAQTTFSIQTRASGKIALKAGSYKVTGCPIGGGTGKWVLAGGNTNVSPNVLFTDSGNGTQFSINNDIPVGMWITVAKNCVIETPITFKPMLRLADVEDSTYEPYHKSDMTTDLTLRAIEVTSSDAYNLVRDNKYYIADTLDYSEDDGFVVTRRIKRYTIDSSNSSSVTVSDLGTDNQRYSLQVDSLINHFVSNRFVKRVAEDDDTKKWGHARVGGADGEYIVLLDSEQHFASLADFQTWANSNTSIFDFELKTPTTETITTAQALALLGLKTYDESTTISSQAEPSCTIAVEYAKERLGALALTAYNTAKGNDLRITALES